MPKNLLEVIGEEMRYLSNPDIASVFRAEYNERYEKYQPGYREKTRIGDKIIEYRNQDLFKFETGTLIERSFSGAVSQYNSESEAVIHHVLVEQITESLHKEIQSNMYHSTALRQFLSVPATGAAAPINIQIKVERYPRVQVTITGPFWLRFFYYGRRAFTIHGRASNLRSRGRLVFYDPQTLEKRIPLEVRMPAIPAGLWVEKAVETIRKQLSNPRFLDQYFPGYDDKERVKANLEQQLNRIRTQDGFAVTKVLNMANKPLSKINVDELTSIAKSLKLEEQRSLENLRSVVAMYKANGMSENRADKSQVYKALREYISNVDTRVVSRASLVSELPSNLQGRSTARKLF